MSALIKVGDLRRSDLFRFPGEDAVRFVTIVHGGTVTPIRFVTIDPTVGTATMPNRDLAALVDATVVRIERDRFNEEVELVSGDEPIPLNRIFFDRWAREGGQRHFQEVMGIK